MMKSLLLITFFSSLAWANHVSLECEGFELRITNQAAVTIDKESKKRTLYQLRAVEHEFKVYLAESGALFEAPDKNWAPPIALFAEIEFHFISSNGSANEMTCTTVPTLTRDPDL